MRNYKIKGIELNAMEMAQIAEYYEVQSTKEYLEGNYANSEEELLAVAAETRSLMDESMANGCPYTEGEAIDEAVKKLSIELIEKEYSTKVDMRIIWKAQLDLCKNIADDILKYKASKEICLYADKFSTIESPYGTSGGYNGNDFIRISYGEAYCYIDLDPRNEPDGNVWWNNDEMGIDEQNNDSYESSSATISMMSLDDAYEKADTEAYAEYAGREDEYARKIMYIPYSDQKVSVEEMREKFVKDGWNENISFTELTLRKAKEKGYTFAVEGISKGRQYFVMNTTGNVFDSKGEIVYYNVPVATAD